MKFLGIIFKEEGYYDKYPFSENHYLSENNILKNNELYIDNNKVYYYPYLKIIMSNDCVYHKFFKSKIELEKYLEGEDLKVNRWVCL